MVTRYLVTSDLRIRFNGLDPQEVILDPGGYPGAFTFCSMILQIQLDGDGVWCKSKMILPVLSSTGRQEDGSLKPFTQQGISSEKDTMCLISYRCCRVQSKDAHDYWTKWIDTWRMPTCMVYNIQAPCETAEESHRLMST